MGLNFQYKEYGWLLIAACVLALLFFLVLKWKKKVRQRIGDEKLINALTPDYSSKKFLLKFSFLIVAFLLGIFGVMNLRKPGDSVNNNREGIDIAIVLDVSKSMLANDLAPNRLERAKQFIYKLMDKMSDDRIALVLFAGNAYLQMPLTVDHGAAKLFVSSASPDAIPQQGTVISDALTMSARVFNSTDNKFKAVVLISDGEAHDADAVRTAKDLATQGVMINTVGVGSSEGTTITDLATGVNKRDDAGNIVISKLDETTLKEIATSTNGIYIKLESADMAASKLKNQLSKIERTAFGDMAMMDFRIFYCWFIGGMLVLLIVEIFISEKNNNRYKSKKVVR